jgi:hypothetical protein
MIKEIDAVPSVLIASYRWAICLFREEGKRVNAKAAETADYLEYLW